MIDFDSILDEVAWKVKSGVPDLSNPDHISVLQNVMVDYGIDESITKSIIANLKEKMELQK